jgi:hypothetical protein
MAAMIASVPAVAFSAPVRETRRTATKAAIPARVNRAVQLSAKASMAGARVQTTAARATVARAAGEYDRELQPNVTIAQKSKTYSCGCHRKTLKQSVRSSAYLVDLAHIECSAPEKNSISVLQLSAWSADERRVIVSFYNIELRSEVITNKRAFRLATRPMCRIPRIRLA